MRWPMWVLCVLLAGCPLVQENNVAQVTVAPAGYTGQADYYCTGEKDEILINAAILYVYTAWGGGTVHLLEGTFSLSSPVLITTNDITLEGSGPGTKLVATGNTDTIYATATATLLNVCVQNMSIDASGQTTSAPAGVHFLDVAYGKVENVLVTSFYSAFSFNGTADCQLIKCTMDGRLVAKTGQVYAIYDTGSRTKVESNVIRAIRTDGDIYGLFTIFASSNSQVIANSIYDLSTSGAAAVARGFYIDFTYSYLDSNRLENIKNSTTAANAYGIVVASNAVSVAVRNNYCYNNGSDTGITNYNSNNFSNAGTDTQVNNNSWQGPGEGYGRSATWTPTFQGFGTTPSNINFHWTRNGGWFSAIGQFTAGAVPTATEARIYLPSIGSQLISDSSCVASITPVGTWGRGTNAYNGMYSVLVESSVSYVTIALGDNGVNTTLTKRLGNSVVSGGENMALNFQFPIKGWNA